MSRTIVVGSDGQDGRILCEQLVQLGNTVMGITRNKPVSTLASVSRCIDVTEACQVEQVIREFQPNEVYYLAAFHHSSEDRIALSSRELFQASYQVHVAGLLCFLQAISDLRIGTRLFYAASSRVFGDAITPKQNEDTPMNPVCAYGITKAVGIQACRLFRREHNVFASAGILYNHESSLRRTEFVSRKIVRGAVRIRHGLDHKLVLGDLSAGADWGWASDYVDAMRRILTLPDAGDFIIATGESHTVAQFVEEAFGQLKLDWRNCVEEDPTVSRRVSKILTGDPSRLMNATGWRHSMPFSGLVRRLLEGEQQAFYRDRQPVP